MQGEGVYGRKGFLKGDVLCEWVIFHFERTIYLWGRCSIEGSAQRKFNLGVFPGWRCSLKEVFWGGGSLWWSVIFR